MGLLNLIEERRLERERRLRKEKTTNALKILAGVGAGVVLGVLFAPKSGKKTRKDIADAAKGSIDFVTENVNTAVKVIKEKGTELKEAVAEKYEQLSSKDIAENIDKLEDKVKETKEKVKKKAEEIEEKIEEKVKEAKEKEDK